MEKKTNTIIIVVVLALAVVAIGWYGVTGGAISTTLAKCVTCSDYYDGGANKGVAGVTFCDNMPKPDYCSGTKLYEYYCVGNTLKMKTMQCPQGCITKEITTDIGDILTAAECRIR